MTHRHKFPRMALGMLASCLIAPAEEGPEKNARDSTYVLRANDAIRLDVFQEPDLSGAGRILKTGHASFPLIGSLEIAGLSVRAASAKIRDLYAKDYLVDPKVTLTVQEYATDFISVIGAVRIAGHIPMSVSGHIDLAAAMATAGGLSETADADRIQLVRASGSSSTFSMASIVNGPNGGIRLEAGDRIIVKESAFVGKSVTVLGQVSRQGPVPFPVDGHLDLVTAIACAGGPDELANPRKITVNRKGKIVTLDYREISQRGDKPFLLQPGDIVNVPERLF